ncbi:MAG TPA: di-heme oxidoredictase family protein [Phycisphaerae bacterium]|nr:di-heme oxidoredictase family protein [Phycisphaerae bacterium]
MLGVLPFRASFLPAAAALSVLLVFSASAQLQPPAGGPLSDLTPEQLARFNAGVVAFDRNFLDSEGLGPGFNQTSCASCHNDPFGGSGTIFVTRFGFADKGSFDPLEYLGGSLLQANSISPECAEIIPPEANVTTLRITSSTLGAGLTEAVPDWAIEEFALKQAPPLSGRVHYVPVLEDPNSPLRVGKFGWKAQLATVLSFSADASLNEMGITNRILPDEIAPNGDPNLLALCDNVPDPEDGPDDEGFHFIDRVTDFQRYSAAPPQTPQSGMLGNQIFNQIGCNGCHVQSFTTANDPNLEPAIRNKVVKFYTDFLLHDMGALGDGIEQGDATIFEIKTAPLWGLRFRDPMLHDGRVAGGTFAQRVEGAIFWHDVIGSEARQSAQAYFNLPPLSKTRLINFLDSLGRREFDADGDNKIDPVDLGGLAGCYSGPGNFYNADHPCAIHDINQDTDVDLDDVMLFLTVYTGWQGDCNKNGINDAIDIATGVLVDADLDGWPDSCCPGDLTNDGVIDQSDLGVLLSAFITGGPEGDLDGDYDTDQEDLGILLSRFGQSCNP